jgi:hypothetical protein
MLGLRNVACHSGGEGWFEECLVVHFIGFRILCHISEGLNYEV